MPVSLAQRKNPVAQTGADSRIDELVSLASPKKPYNRKNPPKDYDGHAYDPYGYNTGLKVNYDGHLI